MEHPEEFWEAYGNLVLDLQSISKPQIKLTRELEKNIFISSSGVIWNGGGFWTQKPVSIFLHWPLSPSSTTSLKGKWRKESFIHLLAARTADFNYGSSLLTEEKKTHIGKRRPCLTSKLKKNISCFHNPQTAAI